MGLYTNLDQVVALQQEVDFLRLLLDEERAVVFELRVALDTKRERPMLTPSELRVLIMVAQGYTDKQIASRFNLSERTVRNHVYYILLKLNLKNRTQAALYAWRNNIIHPEEAWETVASIQWRKIGTK